MQPVVTPAQMREIDAAAADATEVLVERAGAAVARAALRLLGGAYGRRVTVLAGPGNNGADGRAAARRLAARGIRVRIVDVRDAPAGIAGADLVIDAAFGTGFRGEFVPPAVDAPVLAVDIPSGVDGLTGTAAGRPLRATATVTFAAWKPGLLLGDGPELAGDVELADIGLPASSDVWLVEPSDVARWVPTGRRTDHKWRHAVWVVAGSPGMTGAAVLAARGAARAGAGYVRLGIPGAPRGDARAPVEVVGVDLPLEGWDAALASDGSRFGAVVVGPGLGRASATVEAVRAAATRCAVPLVLDGDALWSLGEDATEGVAAGRADRPTVLTPHDGEYERLTGSAPGADRIAAARRLAAAQQAVVLLKGPTTVVAGPDGRVALSASGDRRLATAGTGDVLSGVVGAFLARGAPPFEAAAAAAQLHGLAARLGPCEGMTAGDLPDLLPAALAACREAR